MHVLPAVPELHAAPCPPGRWLRDGHSDHSCASISRCAGPSSWLARRGDSRPRQPTASASSSAEIGAAAASCEQLVAREAAGVGDHGAGVLVEPLLEQRAVDAAEVDVHRWLPLTSSSAQRRELADHAAVDAAADQQRGAGGAVVGAVGAVLLARGGRTPTRRAPARGGRRRAPRGRPGTRPASRPPAGSRCRRSRPGSSGCRTARRW